MPYTHNHIACRNDRGHSDTQFFAGDFSPRSYWCATGGRRTREILYLQLCALVSSFIPHYRTSTSKETKEAPVEIHHSVPISLFPTGKSPDIQRNYKPRIYKFRLQRWGDSNSKGKYSSGGNNERHLLLLRSDNNPGLKPSSDGRYFKMILVFVVLLQARTRFLRLACRCLMLIERVTDVDFDCRHRYPPRILPFRRPRHTPQP
jgi:hypothetical protein